MSIKKLNEFNTLYVEFVNQLRNTYPFVTELYKEELNYTPFEEEPVKVLNTEDVEETEVVTETTTNHTFTDDQLKYLLHYMEYVFPHIKYISRCDEEWFQDEGEDVEVIKGVTLNAILNDKVTTTKQMNRIWEYLQTLYIRSQATKLTVTLLKSNFADHHQYKNIKKSILRYSDYLTLMVEFLSQQRNEVNNEDDEDDNEDEHSEDDDNEKKSKENSAGSNFFDNTLIGNLAKEISEEVDTSHLENINSEQDIFSALFNGNNGSNMMGMMKTVCEKLDNKVKSGELNPQQMLSELGGSMLGPLMKNMMGGVQPNRQQRRRAKKMASKKVKKENKK